MKRVDALGRRRRHDQERGLRPLFPALPDDWTSRALRVSMPAGGWRVLDVLVERALTDAETRARALGEVLMALLQLEPATARDVHWLDFERQKATRLLDAARAA
jgi:hypothetical protein